MAIKRYVANADTTVTNAFRENLTTRGTASNMGRADSLEVFSIYGQESSGSSELSRILKPKDFKIDFCLSFLISKPPRDLTLFVLKIILDCLLSKTLV